jgi:hypothetical protein
MSCFALTHKEDELNQDAHNGRPVRPQRAKRRGVPLRDVEPRSDARTKLAAFLSIMLKTFVFLSRGIGDD